MKRGFKEGILLGGIISGIAGLTVKLIMDKKRRDNDTKIGDLDFDDDYDDFDEWDGSFGNEYFDEGEALAPITAEEIKEIFEEDTKDAENGFDEEDGETESEDSNFDEDFVDDI